MAICNEAGDDFMREIRTCVPLYITRCETYMPKCALTYIHVYIICIYIGIYIHAHMRMYI